MVSANASLSNIYPDIMETHMLPKLDGPSLTAVGSSSSELRSLCTENELWKRICQSTWPSIIDSRVSEIISTFPSGHRSFYQDSFPILHPTTTTTDALVSHDSTGITSELISAIDIRYQNKVVYSKLELTNTAIDSFLSHAMWIEIFEPNLAAFPGFSQMNFVEREKEFLADLEQSVTLNWILIDPTRKRAGNFSSVRPVFARRHWMTNEATLRFVTILPGGDPSEFVQCRIEVTCGGMEGGELHVREVIMQVHDMDSRCLTGEECLVIFQKAMEGGRRKLGKKGEEKENYVEFLKMRSEKREKRERQKIRQAKVDRAINLSIFVVMLMCVIELLFF